MSIPDPEQPPIVMALRRIAGQDKMILKCIHHSNGQPNETGEEPALHPALVRQRVVKDLQAVRASIQLTVQNLHLALWQYATAIEERIDRDAKEKDDEKGPIIPETRELIYLILSYNLEATNQVDPVDQAEVLWRWCGVRLRPDDAHYAIKLLAQPYYSHELNSFLHNHAGMRPLVDRCFSVIDRIMHMHLVDALFENEDETKERMTRCVEWCNSNRTVLEYAFGAAIAAKSQETAADILAVHLLNMLVPISLRSVCHSKMRKEVRIALDVEYAALLEWKNGNNIRPLVCEIETS
jgi:hypothetical protein